MPELKIAGWQKVSLIDYPGKLASVIFLAGCNMRCHYCHNRQIWSTGQNKILFATVLDDLRRRMSWIDAVVVSGGEPTIYPALISLLQALKDLGLQVKLDTNGTRPAVIRQVIELGLVDYVALDIKAPPVKYVAITGMSSNNVLESLRYLQAQKRVPFILRTTLSPRLDLNDLIYIAKNMIKSSSVWQIQQCRCVGAYPPSEVLKMTQVLKKYATHIVVKNL